MARILLVEDEDSIRRLISYDLKNAGFEVVECEDGLQAVDAVRTSDFDLMLLDWMIPGISGIQLVRKFRQQGIDSVMMMLTARDEEENILEAFEAGVDDYMSKPFSPRELLARIQAHIKRLKKVSSPRLSLGDVNLDLNAREVRIKDQKIDLTKKEFELLAYMMQHPQTVLSRDSILNEIWDFDYDGDTRIVDVHIFKLRNKLQDSTVKITSQRGVGYKMEESL